jgi:replicative DNA helicase
MATVTNPATRNQPSPSPISPELFDRVPPQSIEAEKGVLGSILLDSRCLDDLVPLVRPDYFYREAHRKIYQTIAQMYEQRSGGIDTLTVAERLRAAAMLDDVGGAAYLGEVIESVPHAANALHYAEIVREKAVLRNLIHASTEILRDAYDEHRPPGELLAEAERRVFSVLEQQENVDTLQISELLHAAFDRITQRLERGQGMISGLATGFIELDHLTSGFQDSELLILAARPSVGKTALAVNIAEHAAMDEGAPVLFVSLEQSSLELAERLLCARARIDGHRLRNGYLSAGDRAKLVDASGELDQAPLFIDDTPARNMLQIGAIARRFKRRHGLRFIVIDYLQLVEPENRRDPRHEQIAVITRRLKHMARELSVPVLVLAQLNRAVELREGHRPRLADLRESGAIEQDADLVMFLHRDDAYPQQKQEADDDGRRREGVAELIVAKQRNGPTGTVPLAFLKKYMRFETLAEDFDQAYGAAEGYGDTDPF